MVKQRVCCTYGADLLIIIINKTIITIRSSLYSKMFCWLTIMPHVGKCVACPGSSLKGVYKTTASSMFTSNFSSVWFSL